MFSEARRGDGETCQSPRFLRCAVAPRTAASQMEFAGETSLAISVYKAFGCSLRSKDAGVSSCEGVQLWFIGSVPPPCGLGGREHTNRAESRRQLVPLESGVGPAVSLVLPDHTTIHSGPRQFQQLQGGTAFLSRTCLCGFHFSTWCLDCKLQEVTLHRFSPPNKGTEAAPADTVDSSSRSTRPRLPWQPTSAQAACSHGLRSTRPDPRGAALLRGCGVVGNPHHRLQD